VPCLRRSRASARSVLRSRNDERLSHGAPSFFIRDKIGFVNYMDNHHDDGRLALWLPAQRYAHGLVRAQPEQYFVPPYVASAGGSASVWIAADWDDVERVIRDAYLASRRRNSS